MSSSEKSVPSRRSGRALWTGLLVAYVGLIFSTLTLARSLSRWGNRTFGIENLRLGVGTLYGALLLAVLVYFRRKAVSPVGMVLLIAVAGVAAAFLNIIVLPEERIHFMEYILLVSLAWKMLRTWDVGRAPWVAFLLAVGVGALDEMIQRFLPQRVFDWRDIGFNAFGALLGVAVLAIRLRWGREAVAGTGPYQ